MSLVEELRTLTASGTAEYTAGTATFWSDAQLQSVLDRNRSLIDFQPIHWMPQRATSGGIVEYKRGQVETSLRLEANGGTVQVAAGGTVGGWTITTDGFFETTTNAQGTAYYFSAWAYDLNAAAADVCTSWASALKGLVDVSSDDQSLKLSQKRQSLIDMAQEFRKKAPVKEGRLTRADAL
jgi:hypothetical protein